MHPKCDVHFERNQCRENVAAFYKQYGLGLRLVAYSSSADLFSIGSQKSEDVWNATRTSIDFGCTYAFAEFPSPLRCGSSPTAAIDGVFRFYLGVRRMFRAENIKWLSVRGTQ